MQALYHGSEHIVPRPEFGFGKAANDFGRGFYCTQDEALAREWACKFESDGFVNRYAFDDAGLVVLDLLDGSHSVLEWIALLLRHRRFRLRYGLAREARDRLIGAYAPDEARCDVIVGYRADDSYFDYARGFVEGALSLQQLSQALYLGELGEQYVLVSQRSFGRIPFRGAEPVEGAAWYVRFAQRDAAARQAYRQSVKERPAASDDIFILDILRGGFDGNDPRIPRMLRPQR